MATFIPRNALFPLVSMATVCYEFMITRSPLAAKNNGQFFVIRAKFIYHATWKRKELRHANSENANLNTPRPVRMPVPLVHAVGVQFNDEPRQNSVPKDTKEKLFDLVYSCRKETAKGEVMVMTWEECGMVSPPCLDAGTNPETSEVTYQVSVFLCQCISRVRESIRQAQARTVLLSRVLDFPTNFSQR